MALSCPDKTPAPRLLLGAACWAGLFVLYEVLAGGPSWPEVVAGGLASMAATIAVMVSGRQEHLGRMRWGWWLLLIRRIPLEVIRDTMRVLAASVAPSEPRGRIQSVPFDAGGDDPVSASRRALVIFGASIAPNTYVVTIDRERNELLTHQLVPMESPDGLGDPQRPI